MVLISFLYIVTSKVIQHNLEKKIPVYVYYLYKNLENGSYLLTNKLKKEDGNKTKTIEEILNSMNSKDYCAAFAEELNTLGKKNCDYISSVTNESAQYDTTICNRSYSLTFDMDANNIEEISPSYNTNLPDCMKIKEDSVCKYIPKTHVKNLAPNNTEDYHAYSCVIIGNDDVNDSIEIPKPSSNLSQIKLINNVSLSFLDIDKMISESQYNVTLTQVSLNKAFGPIEFKSCTSNNSNYSCTIPGLVTGVSTDKLLLRISDNNNVEVKSVLLSVSWNIMSNLLDASAVANSLYSYVLSKPEASQAITDAQSCGINENCEKDNYTRTYSQNVKGETNVTETYKLNYDEFGVTAYLQRTYVYHDIQPFFPAYKFYNNIEKINEMYKTFTYEKNSSVGSSAYGYYIAADNPFYSFIDKTTFNEDIIKNYKKAHIIYAFIDTPFDKGEMDKNIFTFEQFGNRIIPVGYLANNANTPLKFDVITRNPQTLKINKVNEKPLTFCEAMSYTSETFSEYCGCKDESNKVITKYISSNSQCNNNFGCKIRPVKPSLGGRF